MSVFVKVVNQSNHDLTVSKSVATDNGVSTSMQKCKGCFVSILLHFADLRMMFWYHISFDVRMTLQFYYLDQ